MWTFLFFVIKILSINQKLSLILVITDYVRISFTLRRQITTIACPWLWCIVIGHGNQMPFFVLLVPTQSFNIERKLSKMGRNHFWRCIFYLIFKHFHKICYETFMQKLYSRYFCALSLEVTYHPILLTALDLSTFIRVIHC